jgi:NAD(P)-dependent dehydrogenase (short-subunit alcohol dehydrogenase family)
VDYDLKGRTAFVTGATSGLGKHFAHVLAEAGAKVAIAGRRADRLAEVKKEIEAKGGTCATVVLDVTDAARIAPAFDEVEKALGPIDILVNNAGMNVRGFVTDLAVEDFDTIMGTNLRGPFLMAQEAGRRMIARKTGGRIINTGSIGTFRALPGIAAYCISKAAIGMMTQCLAQEWARYDINVNAICPGYIETELNSGWLRSESGQARIQTFPKKRLQKETDLDGVLLLLASSASSAITGALLPVDDGQSL